MLSKVRLILWLIILLLVAYFVAMNTGNVSVNLLPGYQTVPLPLSIVIIFSVIIGIILALTLTITDWIRFNIERSKLNKRLQICLEEKAKLEQKIGQTPEKDGENNI